MTWRATSAGPQLKDAATVDGYDIQMQTNHLSHFLLTKVGRCRLPASKSLLKARRVSALETKM
jgi:hypothetical protein